MARPLFRRAALERLSTPEQLDQLIPITNPRAWLILLGLLAILIAVLIWGFTGSVTKEFQGRALLINSGGVRQVFTPYAGQIVELSPSLRQAGSAGETLLSAGELVAVVAQPDGSQPMEVLSPHDGRVLEIRATEGETVQAGDSLLSLEFTGDDAPLEAVLYLQPSQAAQVTPGMIVRIAPDGFSPQSEGFLLGQVQYVASFPATPSGMLRLLGSANLVQALAVSDTPVEILVALLADKSSPSGFRWTSTPGPDIQVKSGMLGQANIVVEESRPISLLFGQP